MHINLGNTSGTKLKTDGQTYECKCKLTGDFGISAASDKLSHYGSNYDGFSVVITDYSYGTYIDIQSLYIVAKVSDGKNDSSAEWTAASLPLTLRLSNSLFKTCMYPSLVVALAYKDGAGQSWSWKGTGISDISGAVGGPWNDALSADNGKIASKARIHGTAYTYTQSYSNQVTEFLDNISLGGYEAAAQQVATYSQGANVGLYTPKTGVTQTSWIAKGSSSGVWLWLLSNEAHKNTGSETITIDAKLYRGTADSTVAKTCTLTIGAPYKKESNNMWYVDVSDGTNVVGTKTVQEAYYDGYAAAVGKISAVDDGISVPQVNASNRPASNTTITISVSQENGATNGEQDSTKVRGTASWSYGGTSKSKNSGNGSTAWYDRGKKVGWDLAADNVTYTKSNGHVDAPKKGDYYNTYTKWTYTASSDSHSHSHSSSTATYYTRSLAFGSANYLWYSTKDDKANATESTHSRKGDLYTTSSVEVTVCGGDSYSGSYSPSKFE